MNVDELNELRQVACDTAVSAGKLAREMWSQPRQISHKGFRDLVTDADIATQQCITDAVQARYPDHGFLTEEEDSQLSATGPIIWIIDPIDGTTNYSRQLPEFCVSVAACRPHPGGYEPLAAAIYDPMREELFSAAKGQGATLQIGGADPTPMQVSPITNTAQAVMAVDWSASAATRLNIMGLVNKLAQDSFTLRAIGTAALAMAWVAAGRVDGYLNLRLRPWDVAAALLLLQESGGTIVQPNGEPIVWDTAGMACVASNGRLTLNL
ncbi:MAG: inositol monophosphatase [Anaerolineaceae bacterium]|nr:inositol monophosphatase [Anaerolineaceae bacterium]